MPVMLGGGSSEKLSRCYLGDQLLVGGECTKTYSISTDLRGKTAQQIIDAGWKGVYSKTYSGYTLNSDGLANGSSHNMSAWVLRELPQLNENAIINFHMLGSQSGNGYYAGGLRIGLIDTEAVDGLSQGSSNEFDYEFQFKTDSGGFDGETKIEFYKNPTTTILTTGSGYGNGTIDIYGELNLKELTTSLKVTGSFSSQCSTTITSEIRNYIIQNCKYAFFDATAFGSNGKHYIKVCEVTLVQ